MTVELTYTGDVSGVSASDKQALFSEIDGLHGTENSSSGTYIAQNNSFQREYDGSREVSNLQDTYSVHIGMKLVDADDSDYPVVKDDLAQAIADLSVDFGTKEEIKEQLNGSVL